MPSIQGVKYYWHELIEGAERSNQDNSLFNADNNHKNIESKVIMLSREKTSKPPDQGGILHYHPEWLPVTREGPDGAWGEVRDIKEKVEPWMVRRYASGARGK